MKISIQIVDAGQYVCLDGENAGKIQNNITVRTPNGRLVPISTSEETVSRLIDLLSEIVAEPNPGKEYDNRLPDESASDLRLPSLGQIAEAPIKPQSIPGLGQGIALDSKGYPVRGRNRSVEADEYGYPVVSSSPEPVSQAQIDEEEDPGEQI